MEFLYDLSGRLSAVMDTMGRIIQLEYKPFETEGSGEETRIKAGSGRLIKVEDFTGRALTFEYYENGDLKSVDFEGREKEYTYTENNDIALAHNLLTVKDAKGQTALDITYSGDKVTTADIGGSKIQYITNEGSALVIDGMNNQVQYTLQDGHIKTITEGGYTTTFSYTAEGLIETVIYPELNTVSYGYQGGDNRRSAGNLTGITETPGPRGDGGSTLMPTIFQHDTYYNQVTSITYPNGLIVMNSDPDQNGNFKKVTTSDYTYFYDYNKFGQINLETDFQGMTTSYKYYPEIVPGGNEATTAGRQLDLETGGYLQERSSGLITEKFNKYDRRGNLLEYSDSYGSSGLYTYTTFDELQTENRTASFSLSPLKYKGEYGYDPNGNLASGKTAYGVEGNRLSSSYTYTYTPRNMLWTEIDMGRGITTTYTYDNNDNLESISNGLDSIFFTYNNRDLVVSVRQGSAPGASFFSYDGNGNIITAIDPYGHATTNGYDGYDRLRTIIDPLNNKTVITRLDFGNTLNIQQMDAAENLLRESVRVNDPMGRLQNYTVKIPGGTDEVYNYSYQDNGKIMVITDSLNRSWTTKKNDFGQVYYEEDPAGNYTNYFYEDGRGNMTKKVETEKGDDGTEKNYTTEYTYNAFNKVEEIKEWLEGDQTTPPVITTFIYDPSGNLICTKDGEKNVVTHKYDSFGRKEWTEQYLGNGEKIKTSFEYYPNNLQWKIIDDKGNTTEYKYDDQKRVTKVIYPDLSTLEYTYTEKIEADKKYNMVIEKQRNGTLVTTIYDEMNRVKSRSIEPGPGVEGVTLESYGYDSLSRLTHAENDYSMVVTHDAAASPGDDEKKKPTNYTN
jgi:YD repeat-containing protein